MNQPQQPWQGQPQPQWPYPQQGYQPPPVQPPKRRSWARSPWPWVLIVIAFGAGAGIGAATKSGSDDKDSAAGSTVTVQATPTVTTSAPKPAPARPKVVLDQRGSGIKNTKRFHVSADEWEIRYSYDCSNFGSTGNFIIQVQGDGDADASIAANELHGKNTDSTFQHGAGTYYLSINSECDWRVRVVG